MNGLWMMVIAIVVLGEGYLFYGRWLAKTWGVDPDAKTPAYEQRDGVDYEPADTAVVFGHQFASIAGAGSINGPIQAAVFGWVPVLLWVLLQPRDYDSVNERNTSLSNQAEKLPRGYRGRGDQRSSISSSV